MFKYWNPRQARTPISIITSKYDETVLKTLEAAIQDAIYSKLWKFSLQFILKVRCRFVSAYDVFSLIVALKTKQTRWRKDWEAVRHGIKV